MKFFFFAILSLAVSLGTLSCGKEVKGLKEEMKILKEENSFLKAENIVLKKELDEVYKKLEEKDSIRENLKMKADTPDIEKPKAVPKQDTKVKEGEKKKPR